MKELSIEEKAEAYDLALDRAKKELDACGSQDCDAARQIFRLFPELKESGDERIMKALIDYFRWNTDSQLLNEFTNREVFACLEKFSEQNLIMAKSPQLGEQKPTNKVEPKDYNSIDPHFGKPTTWSEEDSTYYDDICEILINLMHSETAKINKNAVQKDLDWLKALKGRVGYEANCTTMWKPSDEQMDTLRHVISGCSYDIEPLVEMEEQLKKLRGE